MHFSIVPILLTLGCWAQDRTTEAGEAGITDPQVECSPYSYAPVTDKKSAFPPPFQVAKILPNDATAQNLWNSISSKVPTNIAVKPAVRPPGFMYDPSDPDCWWSWAQCVKPKVAGLEPDVAIVPEPSTLGYGFDDGPYCGHNVFYDFLASQDQKTTFYFIGSNVMNFPLEAQRALVDGHEICVHTWSHPQMTTIESADAFAELYYGRLTREMIKLVTGVTPTCWRPPYGDVDDRIRAIAQGLNLQTILWAYDSADWQFGSNSVTKAQIDANYEKMLNDGRNGKFNTAGTIILSHELTNFTMQEAIDLYSQITSVFQHVVPVGVALNKTYPYVETDHVLPSFKQYISGMHTATPSDVGPPPNAANAPNAPNAPNGNNGTNANSRPSSSTSAAPSSTVSQPPKQDPQNSGAMTRFTFVNPFTLSIAVALWTLSC